MGSLRANGTSCLAHDKTPRSKTPANKKGQLSIPNTWYIQRDHRRHRVFGPTHLLLALVFAGQTNLCHQALPAIACKPEEQSIVGKIGWRTQVSSNRLCSLAINTLVVCSKALKEHKSGSVIHYIWRIPSWHFGSGFSSGAGKSWTDREPSLKRPRRRALLTPRVQS